MAWVQPLVKELISHKLSSVVQKKNQNKKQNHRTKNPSKQNRVPGLVPRESNLMSMGICILVFVCFITLFLAF